MSRIYEGQTSPRRYALFVYLHYFRIFLYYINFCKIPIEIIQGSVLKITLVKKTSDKYHGIQVAHLSVVADKLVTIRVTLRNLAIQNLLLNKPLPADFSRFKFYRTQKNINLVDLANNEVSNLIIEKCFNKSSF